MDKNTIINLIKEVSIFPGIQSSEVAQSTGLLSEGIIDSLGLMDLIAGIEKVLKRAVPHEVITVKNFDSVDAIFDLYTSLK